MIEPDNHTVRLLREFSDELRAFREETAANFKGMRSRLENLRQAAIGESVLGRYTVAEVEERLDALEKRVASLEGAS